MSPMARKPVLVNDVVRDNLTQRQSGRSGSIPQNPSAFGCNRRLDHRAPPSTVTIPQHLQSRELSRTVEPGRGMSFSLQFVPPALLSSPADLAVLRAILDLIDNP